MIRKVFGYSPSGEARKFPLAEGESLPEGWSPEPFPGFARHELDVRPMPLTDEQKRGFDSTRRLVSKRKKG